MPKVGLPGGLYYAPLTADDVGVSPVYGSMVKMPGVTTAKITFQADDQEINYEDLTQELIRFISGVTVEISAKELSMATRATLLNHSKTGGIYTISANDIPLWIGLALKIKRIQGGVTYYQYMRLLKLYLQMPDEEAMTREEKLNIKDYTLKFIGSPRKYDEKVVEMTDSGDPAYNATDGNNWFTTFGASDSTPPTISSSSPALNATSVSVSGPYQWTFSEPISPACVNNKNFYLIRDSDQSTPACNAPTLSGDKLTVTLQPTSNLASGSVVYFAVAGPGVTDLAGNQLAAPSVRKFTTL